MSFEALYGGQCSACEKPIKPGQLIDRAADGVGYRHVECPEPTLTVVDLAAGERVCAGCHLVHVGECW